MFSDTAAITAFLDRLMHHGHFAEICVKSKRLHESTTAAQGRKASVGERQATPP